MLLGTPSCGRTSTVVSPASTPRAEIAAAAGGSGSSASPASLLTLSESPSSLSLPEKPVAGGPPSARSRLSSSSLPPEAAPAHAPPALTALLNVTTKLLKYRG